MDAQYDRSLEMRLRLEEVEKRKYTLLLPVQLDIRENDLYDKMIEKSERGLLEAVMLECKYNQSAAARKLGISRVNLRTKLERHFDDAYFSRVAKSVL